MADPCERLRRWLDAVERRDVSAAIEQTQPDVRFHSLRLGTRQLHQGHEGVRAFIEQLRQDPRQHRVVVHDVRPFPNAPLVAADGELTDGESVLAPFSAIARFRYDRIAEVRHYLSELSLLEQIGFSPHDRP